MQNLNQQLSFFEVIKYIFKMVSLAYLLTDSCSGWSVGNAGRGRNSPRPNDSWLRWSEFNGSGVAVGMWPASVSSRDTLLLDNERSRGRRSLKPLGRPAGTVSKRWHSQQGKVGNVLGSENRITSLLSDDLLKYYIASNSQKVKKF